MSRTYKSSSPLQNKREVKSGSRTATFLFSPYLVEDDVAQVGRQWRGLFHTVLLYIRIACAVELLLFACDVEGRGVLVEGLKVRDVDEVVDATLHVSHRELIGGEAPLIVDNELEGLSDGG
jgi:hypothetical protein